MSNTIRVAILPGDGIGPEVMEQSVQLLQVLQEYFDLKFEFIECPVGGKALREFGTPLPDETLEKCKSAAAVLLGTVGDPEFNNNPIELQPDHALVALRTGLDTYCGFRSVRLNNVTPVQSSQRSTAVKNIDFVVVRDLQNGLYYKEYIDSENEDRMMQAAYDEKNIKRVARRTFELARIRRRSVTIVDKAHQNSNSRWWRAIVRETTGEFPLVRLKHISLKDCLENLKHNPFQFDVILTEPACGKAVNESAEALISSSGRLASACLGDGASIYQPVHRAHPEMAGKNIASPIAMMHSVAMMLHYSFDLPLAAKNIEDAISAVEIRGDASKKNGTREIGRNILEEMLNHLSAQPIMTV